MFLLIGPGVLKEWLLLSAGAKLVLMAWQLFWVQSVAGTSELQHRCLSCYLTADRYAKLISMLAQCARLFQQSVARAKVE